MWGAHLDTHEVQTSLQPQLWASSTLVSTRPPEPSPGQLVLKAQRFLGEGWLLEGSDHHHNSSSCFCCPFNVPDTPYVVSFRPCAQTHKEMRQKEARESHRRGTWVWSRSVVGSQHTCI